MKPKFNNICPSCNNSIFKKVETYGIFIRYKCAQCKTVIYTQKEGDDINSYFMDIRYNKIIYKVCFYFSNSYKKFTIYYMNNKFEWDHVLTLPFHPQINYHNLENKLKTYLLFR